MKRIFIFFLSLLISPVLLADTYTIDPDHSYVLYEISHFGFSVQTGKWPVTGTLELDPKAPQNSKVNVTIQMDKLNTGNPELDQHLKGPLFFDIAKYPTATFQNAKVIKTSQETATLQGTLTLHGIAKPVTLLVQLNKIGTNLITNKPSVGFNGKTTLKRSSFNVKGLLPGISDDVNLNIQVEAYK